MAAPTTEFNEILTSLAADALDTNAERLAIDDVISTGAGNELDFGNVNISGGAANSSVKAMFWQVTVWGTNTQVENFRFYIPAAKIGFDQAGSVINYATWKLDAPSEWVQNPTTGDVGVTQLPESEPAQNVFQGGDGTTTYITDVDADTCEAIAMYVAVAAGETAGTYKGTDAGFELQFEFTYDYF